MKFTPAMRKDIQSLFQTGDLELSDFILYYDEIREQQKAMREGLAD